MAAPLFAGENPNDEASVRYDWGHALFPIPRAKTMTTDALRIGAGAGFQGDRFEPAIILAEPGNLDYLVLECLAERTIALAQKNKLDNPALGYDPFLKRLAARLSGWRGNRASRLRSPS